MPTILITGVSSGLGRALALRAHAAGWKVIGTVRDDRAPEAHDMPEGVEIYRLESRFPQAVRPFAERVLADHGAPDVLVNNAAHAVFGPSEEVAPDELRELFQVNVFAAHELVAALLPALRERGSGVIASIGSIADHVVYPHLSATAASTCALEALSEGLYHELAPFGIRVKIIEPGYADTPITTVVGEHSGRPGPYLGQYEAAAARLRMRLTSADGTEAAEWAWRALMDPSDRLRYPLTAYARRMIGARRLLGERLFLRMLQRRWQRV